MQSFCRRLHFSNAVLEGEKNQNMRKQVKNYQNTFRLSSIGAFFKCEHVFVGIENVHPLLAAVFASCLVGIGMIILFRHGSGVGGASILAHFLQERGIMRAGIFLLIFDLTVLSAGIFVLPWQNLVFSVIGAVVMNIEIAMNHRPGRYFGK